MHSYQNPERYSKNNNLQFHFAMQVLAESKINSTDKVLDLGCGDGRITFEIAQIANQGMVIGTDISRKMIEHANQTYSRQQNLRFLEMDSSKNIFKEQFDVITSFNSLHWVKNQQAALEGIATAAVHNAKIILLLSHKKSYYHTALDCLINGNKWRHFFENYSNPRCFFSYHKYEALLNKTKLSIVTMTEEEMVYRFNSVDNLKQFFLGSMVHVNQIPDNLKEDFLEDFCTEFLNQINCENLNFIPINFWCLRIIVTKI